MFSRLHVCSGIAGLHIRRSFRADGADQALYGVFVEKDAEAFGAPFDLAVDALERIG
jgi:hypothetical protein